MVFKVLNIAASVLMGLCTLALAACLVFTVASPVVQQGFDNIGEAVNSLVSQAIDAMAPPSSDPDATAAREPGFFERIGGFFANLFGANAPAPTVLDSAPLPQDGRIAANQGPALADFADPYVGQAYLSWRNAVADPVRRVLVGTGVGTEVLEGVAAGSATARAELLACSDAAFDLIASNVSAYRTSVVSAGVPGELSSHAKVQVSAANTAALEFCDAASVFIDDTRMARNGNLDAQSRMATSADAMARAIAAMEDAMRQAEQLLGVSG